MRKDADNRGVLGWWRRYRLSSLGLIPADTRVDPSLFPEDEFPLVCPKCNYSLRGLPDNICPECGSQFDRGRLLVEQYVIEGGKRHLPSKGTAASIFSTVALLIMCVGYPLGGYLTTKYMMYQVSKVGLFNLNLMYIPLGAAVAGVAIMGISLLLDLLGHKKNKQQKAICKERAKRVSDAIDKTTPAFHKARRASKVIGALSAVIMFSLLVWQFDWRFFLRHPMQTVGPLVVVFAVGLLVWWIRRKKRS